MCDAYDEAYGKWAETEGACGEVDFDLEHELREVCGCAREYLIMSCSSLRKRLEAALDQAERRLRLTR